MSENPDESEVFEICDFTTPTEWERFVARLEEVLHEWQLNGTNLRFWYQYPDKSFALGVWRRISEELTFGATFPYSSRLRRLFSNSILESEKPAHFERSMTWYTYEWFRLLV
ncbi:unnamed protein product [Notodromas monacha]|uniref:Rab3 GTPase-activating protein catalytic subunit n=1 Tax=Notodromas monacha TaxID=399045 RepID=A0A7R9GA41_9CRUS|nr:unnamed protein product [Notodromas monacha]CAG0913609.1 unnamed protein product [Notodromas monacha]